MPTNNFSLLLRCVGFASAVATTTALIYEFWKNEAGLSFVQIALLLLMANGIAIFTAISITFLVTYVVVTQPRKDTEVFFFWWSAFVSLAIFGWVAAVVIEADMLENANRGRFSGPFPIILLSVGFAALVSFVLAVIPRLIYAAFAGKPGGDRESAERPIEKILRELIKLPLLLIEVALGGPKDKPLRINEPEHDEPMETKNHLQFMSESVLESATGLSRLSAKSEGTPKRPATASLSPDFNEPIIRGVVFPPIFIRSRSSPETVNPAGVYFPT